MQGRIKEIARFELESQLLSIFSIFVTWFDDLMLLRYLNYGWWMVVDSGCELHYQTSFYCTIFDIHFDIPGLIAYRVQLWLVLITACFLCCSAL